MAFRRGVMVVFSGITQNDSVNHVRVKDLSNKTNIYKVSINAKQLGLTGFSLRYAHMNLVCVQGGNKAIKTFKKLMLRRIKWGEF